MKEAHLIIWFKCGVCRNSLKIRLVSEHAHEHIFKLEFLQLKTHESEYTRVPWVCCARAAVMDRVPEIDLAIWLESSYQTAWASCNYTTPWVLVAVASYIQIACNVYLHFSKPFFVSRIQYSSEHNLILEHGFELTHSSMFMLTNSNNPDLTFH